jgi:hypothetical protein
MKTLSKTFRFVVLGVIVMVAVVSCCIFPPIVNTRAYATVEIGNWSLANSKDNVIYVEWKDEAQFKTALEQVCDHQGEYDLFILRDNHEREHWKKNCNPNPPQSIKTVKVTKSKAADNIAAGESAVNDPHATYRIQSPDPRDIIKVLGTLKPPAP